MLIHNLSILILNFMLKNQVIENTSEDKEYYQYGIEITLSSKLNIVLVVGIGAVCGRLSESLIFLVCFVLIRQFTGGFHANTYFKCNLILCISFLTVLSFYIMTSKFIDTYFSVLITFLCVAFILAKCPIEHPNKPIPKGRKKFHKIIAASLGAFYGLVGTILIWFSNTYGALILYTLLLVMVLIVISDVSDWRCKNENFKENS